MDSDFYGDLSYYISQSIFLHNKKFSQKINYDKLSPLLSEKFNGVQRNMIAILNREGPKNMCEFAAQLFVQRTNLTKLADELVQKGYIERFHMNNNRRMIYLGITEKGRELLQHEKEFNREFYKETLNKLLTSDEQQKLFDSYKYITEVLEKV